MEWFYFVILLFIAYTEAKVLSILYPLYHPTLLSYLLCISFVPSASLYVYMFICFILTVFNSVWRSSVLCHSQWGHRSRFCSQGGGQRHPPRTWYQCWWHGIRYFLPLSTSLLFPSPLSGSLLFSCLSIAAPPASHPLCCSSLNAHCEFIVCIPLISAYYFVYPYSILFYFSRWVSCPQASTLCIRVESRCISSPLLYSSISSRPSAPLDIFNYGPTCIFLHFWPLVTRVDFCWLPLTSVDFCGLLFFWCPYVPINSLNHFWHYSQPLSALLSLPWNSPSRSPSPSPPALSSPLSTNMNFNRWLGTHRCGELKGDWRISSSVLWTSGKALWKWWASIWFRVCLILLSRLKSLLSIPFSHLIYPPLPSCW